MNKKKVIFIIVITVVLVASIAVGLSFLYQYRTQTFIDALQIELSQGEDAIEELNAEIVSLNGDLLVKTDENDVLNSQYSELEQELSLIKDEIALYENDMPRADLGVSVEIFNSCIYQVAKNTLPDTYEEYITPLQHAPIKTVDEWSYTTFTYYLQGDESSESFLLLSIRINRYNNNVLEIVLQHSDCEILYEEYSRIIALSYVMSVESPLFYSEEIIDSASGFIAGESYENGTKIIKTDTTNGQKLLITA